MKRSRDSPDAVDFNLAQVLMLLSQQQHQHVSADSVADTDTTGRVFECKTCNRQFPSFQALGGHRASHKKPRLVVDADGHVVPMTNDNGPKPPTKPRTHECSICGVEFALGQALGGHMRRHRVAALSAAGSGADVSGEEGNNHLVVDQEHKNQALHKELQHHEKIFINPPQTSEVSKKKAIAYYGGASSARIQLANNAFDLNGPPQSETPKHHRITNDPLELTLRCNPALDLFPSLVH